MQASEIREMTDEDVRARIAELQEERFRLRFRSATETLENPMRLRFIRRDIARLHTVLRERELGLNVSGGAPSAAPPAKKRATAKRATAPRAKRAAGAKGATGAERGRGAKGAKGATNAKGARGAKGAKNAKSR